jgi:hypothetical protein
MVSRKKSSDVYLLPVVIFAICISFSQISIAEREALRGAAGGALKGAAVGELSGGDAGKGAAWGAAAGAARGVAQKKQAEQAAIAAQEKAAQDARIRELELEQAYEKGRRDASSAGNSNPASNSGGNKAAK